MHFGALLFPSSPYLRTTLYRAFYFRHYPDFTVMVKNLPQNVTEQEVAVHFSNLLGKTVAEVKKWEEER